MDSIKFQQILDANLMQSVKKLKLKRGWLLQMDNDPKHTSKSTVDYIKRHKLKVLPWPSQSPDLNIIENLWIDLKRAVRDRQPRNLKELEDFCKEQWAKIPQTRIERLLASYKKAFTSCDTCQRGQYKVLTLQGAQTPADTTLLSSAILKV